MARARPRRRYARWSATSGRRAGRSSTRGIPAPAIGRAHDAVVALGRGLPPEIRPRATCAVCLVQGSSAYWAHVGDSRIYQLRAGKVFERTRDHSHVELLLRDGRITESQAHDHPMRNYVECCIGGEPVLPEMSLSGAQRAQVRRRPDGVFRRPLVRAHRRADRDAQPATRSATCAKRWPGSASARCSTSAPYADNTTAAAVRWLGT